jgi:hypothetical protein
VDSRETAVSHAGLWKTAKSGHSGLLQKKRLKFLGAALFST